MKKQKTNNMTGEKNSNYKDGRTLIKHYCIDCKINEISYHNWLDGNKRCLFCAHKGTNNPNYKEGVTLQQHYCKCGNEISLSNFSTGLRMCRICSHIKEKNHNWQGGISKLPYSFDFTEELKESIRKRDNYECQNCGMTEEEHLIVIGKSLGIHHIDYDKENCNKNNLITLCNYCNTRANFNKIYWKEFYQNKRR
jgi:hypothetical protein